MIPFSIATGFLIVQRLIELRIAKRNTSALFTKGAEEFGGNHYWMLVALHSLFIASMIFEFLLNRPNPPDFWPVALCVFLAAQIARVWIIRTMNGRWTTRIIVLPGTPLVAQGPFRYFPHPNYLVVALEIASFPMIFGLAYSAVVFTLANAFVLGVIRIPEESRALKLSKA